jgi:hypothetical protein
VDPRTGLDGCGSPPPGLDPRTVQPVASRYTELCLKESPPKSRSFLTSVCKKAVKCTEIRCSVLVIDCVVSRVVSYEAGNILLPCCITLRMKLHRV